MLERSVLETKRRQYLKALLEMKRAIELEVKAIEEKGSSFEPSDGISGVAFNVAMCQKMLSGVIEGSREP